MDDPRVEKLSEVVKRDPKNLKGWLDLGVVLQSLDRKSEAAKCFKTAADINPKAEEAWTRLGDVLAGMNHHDKALDCFLNATKINPNSPHAWNWLAMSYCFNGDVKKGMEAARRAAGLDPEYQKTVEWVKRAREDEPARIKKLIDDVIHRVSDETGAAIVIKEPRISLESETVRVDPLQVLGITFKGSGGAAMRANVIDRLNREFSANGLPLVQLPR